MGNDLKRTPVLVLVGCGAASPGRVAEGTALCQARGTPGGAGSLRGAESGPAPLGNCNRSKAFRLIRL